MFLYKRQRLLLTLVKAMGGSAPTTDVQKLLFLYTQEREGEKSFDFVPYKFGCFSFQSYADRNVLIRKGLLMPDEENRWELSPQAEAEIKREQLKEVSYFAEDLPKARGEILKLEQLLAEHGRIALTCFEKEHHWCHRHCVAEEMERVLTACPQTQHI